MRLATLALVCLVLARPADARTPPISLDPPEAPGGLTVVGKPAAGSHPDSPASLQASCYGTVPYFRRSTTCAISGSYSLWAGVTASEAVDLGYAAGQGYGDSWEIPMVKSFSYAGGGESLQLEFDHAQDSEPDFDYLRVEVDWPGSGGPHLVTQFTGTNSTTHVTLPLSPGTELPGSAATISIRFVASSDGAWSDQDGLYPTECGLATVDNIRLTAMPSNTTLDFSDFESGTDGWAIEFLPVRDCGPPANFAAVAQCGSILLTWDAVPGAGGYQIFRDGDQISGTVGTSKTDLTPGTGQRCYYLRAVFFDTGEAGPPSSALCRTAISEPPTTTDPSSQAVSPGASVSFAVIASGVGLSFQWRKDTTAIPGATLDHYDIASAQAPDAGSYDVVVSNACGTVTSAAASLTVDASTPNSAVILERIFNDCPFSTLTTTNNYPTLVSITDDADPLCIGYANLHLWRFSADGASQLLFNNDADYSFSADVTITGTGDAEAGLQISPWWSQADGRFNCRSTDGEIACFGGRLPFYNFTTSDGLFYVKGTTVHLEMIYRPNGLSAASPATIEYRYTDNSGLHSSGPLPFDEANIAEDPPHGLWGQLNDAEVGGYFMYLLGASTPDEVTASWANIVYTNNAAAPLYTITASAGAGGTITPVGAVQVSSGEDKPFAMAADPCHHVTDVLVDGVSVGAVSSYTFTAVDADHTIAASFAPDQLTITLQPLAQVVCSGGPATFSTAATGAPGATFQWRKGTINIPGATSSTLALVSVGPLNAGSYDVVVTSPCGTVTSNAAVLTVHSAPAITLQPISQVICSGRPVSFSVAATGTPTPAYQWRRNGIAIGGATASTFTIPATFSPHAGVYDVMVTNSCGTALGGPRTLTVNQPPVISPQPVSSLQRPPGTTAVFSAGVTGTPPVALQWYKGNTPLVNNGHFSGVNGTALTINGVINTDAGYYQLIATNSCTRAASYVSYLDVLPCPGPPVITLQPVDQLIPAGASATLSVAATTCSPMTYQWYRSGTNGVATTIPGATQASYTIPSVAAADRAWYYCAVSTRSQYTLSRRAALNVLDPAIPWFYTYSVWDNYCSQIRLQWGTNVPMTGVVSYGDDCANLMDSTAPTPLATYGTVDLNRPVSGVLKYRLTVTMPSSAQAQGPCRTWVFPTGDAWLSGSATSSPYYVQRTFPEDGINIGMLIRNAGCANFTGEVAVLWARLNGAPPRDLLNIPTPFPISLPVDELVPGQTMTLPEDLSFRRSEVNGRPGSTVPFTATIRYYIGTQEIRSYVYTNVTLP